MRRAVNIGGAAVGLHAMIFVAMARLEPPPPAPMTYTVEPVLLPPPPREIPSEPAPLPVPLPLPGSTSEPKPRATHRPRPRATSPVASAARVGAEPAPQRTVAPAETPPPDTDASVLFATIGRAGRNSSAIDGGLGNADGEGPAASRGSAFLRGGARGGGAPAHESRAEPARPVEDYTRLVPPYSEEAIQHDVSASVSMRVEVDEEGRVVHARILKGAGYGLDELALEQVQKYRFKPATDAEGRPVRAVFGWRIVWESHWKRLVTTTIAGRPNCRGQGPLNLGEIHPVYVDCDGPAGYFELAPQER